MAHTHGCPKCGTITVHFCTVRNVGTPDSDCPPCCEYDVDGGEFGNYCEDCYEQVMDDMEAELVEGEVDRFADQWRVL